MLDERISAYLKKIDEVIANGKFKDDWESLAQFKVPSWLRRDRFGLFIHWGAYAVPAFHGEWYPRNMYDKHNPCFSHRVKTYGEDADYRQIVEQFRPTQFDAQEWLSLFKESGARYIMPVHEHHDGIKMYKSELNRWNTMDMPMHRDYMAELREAADEVGMGFLASNHRAEHYWFLNGARKNCSNSEVSSEEYRDLYGPAALVNGNMNCQESDDFQPSAEWCADWLASSCEMVDHSRPLAVYFDWWVYKQAFRPYYKKFLAYYYNRAEEWGIEAAVFDKKGAALSGTCVFDVERGQADGILPELWQCDTATARNSWGYTEGNQFKSVYDLVTNLIDVISKNGCFMLNVGPKADGSICEEDKKALRGIGEWLKTNGEAIYDSLPFFVYGEGKKQKSGSFHEKNKYGANDFRFTVGKGCIYAFTMGSVIKNSYKIKTLKAGNAKRYGGKIQKVEIVGRSNSVDFKCGAKHLELKINGEIQSDLPICFKLTF